MQFMVDEEKLQFLTCLDKWLKQVAECIFPYLDLVWCTYPIVS